MKCEEFLIEAKTDVANKLQSLYGTQITPSDIDVNWYNNDPKVKSCVVSSPLVAGVIATVRHAEDGSGVKEIVLYAEMHRGGWQS